MLPIMYQRALIMIDGLQHFHNRVKFWICRLFCFACLCFCHMILVTTVLQETRLREKAFLLGLQRH